MEQLPNTNPKNCPTHIHQSIVMVVAEGNMHKLQHDEDEIDEADHCNNEAFGLGTHSVQLMLDGVDCEKASNFALGSGC